MIVWLRKKWKNWKRVTRKQHPFVWGVHAVWWLFFGALYAFYFRFFVHTKNWFVVLYFVWVQVLFFYVAFLFILKAPIRFNRLLWLFGLKCVGWMVLETACFMAVLIAVSISRGKIHVDRDFSKPFHVNVWNIPHFVFAFVALGVVQSALFFYMEREKLARRYAVRVNQLNGQMHSQLLLLDREWRKWQMDPHLLSHLFTSLRAKIRTAKPGQLLRVMNYLISLSDFYVLRARSAAAVWLKEELRQVHCLLAMERIANLKVARKIRYLNLDFPPKIPHVKIIPMLLLVLVENILEHATEINKLHPAVLSLQEREGILYIRAENYFDPKIKKLNQREHHGVALMSIKSRIGTVHPGAVFTNQRLAGRYVVEVHIPIYGQKAGEISS